MKDDKTRVGSGWQLDDPTPPTVEKLIAELDSLIFVDYEKTIVHVDCDKPYLLNLIEKALTQTIAEYQEDIKLLTEEIEHLRKDLANLINAVPDNHRD